MRSEWYCFTDDESGPHSFAELADRIARGELLPSDLVRRAESREWQQVDSVVGLMHRASQPARVATPMPVSMDNLAAAPAARPWQLPTWDRRWILPLISVSMILFCMVEIWWWLRRRPERFPSASPVSIRFNIPQQVDQMRPRLLGPSTLPELPRQEPVLVPGFEERYWLKSPTLSADLLTIVYVGYSGETNLDDLYLADRKSQREPFSRHRPIESALTEGREAHPALSPDGCELIHVRLGETAQLFRCRRANLECEFGPPQPLVIGNDPARRLHHDAPRFVDDHTLTFTTWDEAFRQRRHHVARRTGRDAPWVFSNPLPVADPWPRYVSGPGLKRAYFLADDGLHVTALHPRTRQFLTPALWLEQSLLGSDLVKFDDTFWISPREDLMFYCSPGRAPEHPDHRRLWMLRF